MSYVRAHTQNLIGMRRVRTRPTLGVFRGPAEMRPVSQLFGTRPIAALKGMRTFAPPSAPTSVVPTTITTPTAMYVLERPWMGSVAAQDTPTPQTTAPAAPSAEPQVLPGGASYASAVSNTPPTPAPSVNVTNTTSDWMGSITTWLQSNTIIPSIPNFFLVAGVGVVGLMLWPRGRR